jgi:outer membrane protein assembly factor BamE (lipoprotein component of BamABCDE complex)
MYIKRLSLVLIATLFLCICIWFFYVEMPKLRSGRASLPSEIVRASKEFKAQAGYRETQAKKLLPYLKVGMAKGDIQSLLGEPDSKTEFEYYASMNYIVGRSNMITVFFDEKEKVIHVESPWTEYSSPIERVWPLLRPGMTKDDILSRLGSQQKELKDGKEWQYQYRDDPIVFTITFDGNDKVVKLKKN